MIVDSWEEFKISRIRENTKCAQSFDVKINGPSPAFGYMPAVSNWKMQKNVIFWKTSDLSFFCHNVIR